MALASKILGIKWDGASAKPEELRLSRMVGELVREISGRDDLMARVGPEAAGEHPARYIPALAEIEVSTKAALPEDTDLWDVEVLTPAGKAEYAVMVGAVAHEASHSVHTKFLKGMDHKAEALTGMEFRALTILEESRCERNQLERRPGDRRYIRACINKIVAPDIDSLEGIWGAAHAAALMLARVDSGVLEEDDVTALRAAVVDIITQDTLDELQKIWQDNFKVADDDYPALAENGRRWVRALMPQLEKEREELEKLMEMFKDLIDKIMEDGFHGRGSDPEPGEGSEGSEGASGKPEEGDGPEADAKGGGDGDAEGDEGDEDGKPDKGSSPYSIAADAEGGNDEDKAHADDGKATPTEGSHGRGMGGAVQAAADDAAAGEKTLLADMVWERVRDSSADRKIADERKARATAKAEAKGVAAKVFKRATDGAAVTSGRVVTGHRAPTAEERAAAVKIGAELDKAKYRDRTMVKRSSTIPPGRMRGRGAVSWSAQRARGEMVTAEPWKRTMRKHTDEAPLTVGMMTDVSGSMGTAAGPIATASWVMTAACHRIQAKVASVTFGDVVDAIAYPNTRPDQVTTFSAHGGSEAFKKGFLALDGALNLLGGEGARLLVVSSDNYLVNGVDESFRRAILPQLIADGVGVLWLFYGEEHRSGLPKGVETVNLGRHPNVTDAAKIIGAAAKRAIEKASPQG
jgi:hypothetical protein